MDSHRARGLLRRERERIERALAGELAASLREQLAAELAAVERAEERLALGTYGLSMESGEPMPDERLEAHPTAERTVEEQARLER